MDNLKKLVIQENYKVLAEDSNLQFTIVINNVTDDVFTHWRLYEIDHCSKIIYLEAIPTDFKSVYIVSNDDLELPIAIVKNLNEAAKFMNVEATHVYRADRREGRPERLKYNDFILIKNII